MSILTLKHKLNEDNNFKCRNCRLANHNTNDYEEGLIFCKFAMGTKSKDSVCSMSIGEHYMFEEYNGKNDLWFIEDTIEIIKENE